jgi:hypothetical protein
MQAKSTHGSKKHLQPRLAFNCAVRSDCENHRRHAHYHRAWKALRPALGLRITVWDVRGWLAAGETEDQIIEDYPEMEKAYFRGVYEYAARMRRRVAQ